jgi:hypothetical protein
MLKFLGISFLVLLACVAMFVIWGTQQDRSARRYLASAVPAIFNEWDIEALQRRASDELKNEPQFGLRVPVMFLMLRDVLGPLKTIEEPQGSAGFNWGNSGPAQGTYGDYLIRARFERGEAELRLLVVREGSNWRIRAFNVNSPALLKLRNDMRAINKPGILSWQLG